MVGLVTDLDRSRVWFNLKTCLFFAVALSGLLLLCSCTEREGFDATLTDTPSFEDTAGPTATSTASPDASTELTPKPLAISPDLADAGTAQADLAIQVLAVAPIVPGETAVYTLTVRNHGPAVASNVILTDLLPAGVIPVWTQALQPECGRQASRASCDLGLLRGGDTITVSLDLSLGGTEQLVTGTQLAGLNLDLSVPTCQLDRAANQVTCQLSRLHPGRELEIPIGVELATPSNDLLLHTVTISADQTDDHLANNQATFTLTAGTGQNGPAAPAETPAAAEVDLVLHPDAPANIFAGQSFTYTYTITNQGTLEATGVNFASTLPPATELIAYSPGRPLCESNGSAFTCALRDPYNSGETITFSLQTTGHDQQPVIIELDPLMPGWPICTVLKERTFLHILICELGELKPNQSLRIDMTITAEGVRERSIDNPASVQSNEPDLTPGDNVITTTTAVQISADLALWSTIEEPAIAGETLSYTLTVTNLGPSDAAGVALDHPLPAGTNWLSAVASEGWECQLDDEHLSCEAGRLSANDTATVTITVEVNSSLPPSESITFTAQVKAEQSDPEPGNNQLSIPLSVGRDD